MSEEQHVVARLRRLWNRSRQRGPRSRPELERALACLVLEPPHATWAALVSVDGRLAACFPSRPAKEQDRITAMSAAIASLGERICRELHNGDLRYGVLAGEAGATLVVALDRDHVLTLGLSPDAPVDVSVQAVRESAIVMQALSIVGLPA